ncbi:hypothetical protein BH10ACI1_BH10ACI1_31370 [soil metagenome]
MCCQGFWKRIAPFAIALMIGLFAVSFSPKENLLNKNQKHTKLTDEIVVLGENNGIIACNPNGFPFEKTESVTSFIGVPTEIYFAGIYHLKIISEPRAKYTEAARQNRTQGKVVLRVTFLANRKTGNISVISGLPDGLTEQSILAAKQIKFEPASSHGTSKNTTTTVIYTYTIY